MSLQPRFSDELLTWPEIEKAFRDRLSVAADVFYALREAYRELAFTVRQIADMQTLARVKERLERSIARGEQLAEFLEWVEDAELGWSRAYTGLVFRQNVFSAAARGRWEEINDPDVADEFGWLMYDAVDDDRTRDEHAIMDGRTWRRDEFPDEWYPPNGFNCRCSVRQLNDYLLRRTGGRVQGGPPDVDPDEGFRVNQARGAVLRDALADELARVQREITR